MSDTNEENTTNVLTNLNRELLGSKEQIIAGLSTDDDMDTGDHFQVVRDRRKAKRVRQELDSSIEDEWKEALVNNDAVAEQVSKIQNRIRRICTNDPSRMISQKITNYIMGQVESLTTIVNSLLSRNSYLKGLVDGKESEISSL